ncbi:glycogen synthase [Egicoccus halophilus]|uniref:Glycosyl transferase family 1 n=1 Tax=Egicoccus halophilus TaxID=1670830 RepID=A0A8J3A617_9ACTN|nr:glycogen synthase [Egicoccus halophilus]GGI04172.1 glycosyl transferase family 1 [Egicoccus halophilus]
MSPAPRVGLLTKEYPPEIYGGAGVHVAELARALDGLVDLEVHAFGAPREDPLVAGTYREWDALAGDAPELAALRTVSADLAMTAGVAGVEVVHSHTWYANLAGHLAKLVYGIPHVATTHSLEPLRPWKREQLGGGYALSSFCERTALEGADAVIAVSHGMRDDVVACYPDVDPDRVVVIHNGVDPQRWRRVTGTGTLLAQGIDPDRPYAVFVGRITRQKGVTHLLDVAERLPAGSQMVLCAGAPDTPQIAEEFRTRVAALADAPVDVVWIEQMLPRDELLEVLSGAAVFVCPSIYEPFGIVNLEAMACGLPVVASAVGGIPEIVVRDETGWLVDFAPGDDAIGSPTDPSAFADALAAPVARCLADPELATRMGAAGRRRVEEHFSWTAIAGQTAELYRSLAPGS